jgi:hypothetical protein
MIQRDHGCVNEGAHGRLTASGLDQNIGNRIKRIGSRKVEQPRYRRPLGTGIDPRDCGRQKDKAPESFETGASFCKEPSSVLLSHG